MTGKLVRIFLLLLSFAVIAHGVGEPSAFGSGITNAWSGASASTTYDSQSSSQQGATASASSSGQSTLSIQPTSNPVVAQDPIPLQTSGSVGASAGIDPAHLLQVTASANSPDPGSSYVILGSNDSATASASWSNDAVMVKAPAGSSTPDMIRLNFTMTFVTPGTLPGATLTATFNGQKDVVYSSYGTSFSHVDASGNVTNGTPASIDSTNANGGTSSPYPAGGLKDSFHIDLPVSSSGLSAPFNLSLALNPPVGLNRDTPTIFDGLAGNLALTSVTLPDGTILSSLGDSVSFESGLGVPDAVPEPASLLAWGLGLAGVVAWKTRRVRSISY
jgi:hypothetical protein